MAGPYNIYPAVDAGYNFPPEIRTSLLSSTDVKTALDATRDAGSAKAVAAVGKSLTGAVTAYAGPSAPAGWLLCDGSAVSRTDYADLFALIGTTYGSGNGTTTFNVPNLSGRVAVGMDNTRAEFNTLGGTGGEIAHKLVSSEMPAHTHVQNAHNHGLTDPGHNHTQNSHGHGVNDPSHYHGVSDPSHGHNVNDPGHGHGPTTLDGFVTYQTNTATRRQLATSTTSGVFAVASSPDNTGLSYGSAKNSGTGISLSGSYTGIGVNPNTTGVSVQGTTASNNPNSTGISLATATAVNQNTGGDGSHNNLQPYMALNFIIHV